MRVEFKDTTSDYDLKKDTKTDRDGTSQVRTNTVETIYDPDITDHQSIKKRRVTNTKTVTTVTTTVHKITTVVVTKRIVTNTTADTVTEYYRVHVGENGQEGEQLVKTIVTRAAKLDVNNERETSSEAYDQWVTDTTTMLNNASFIGDGTILDEYAVCLPHSSEDEPITTATVTLSSEEVINDGSTDTNPNNNNNHIEHNNNSSECSSSYTAGSDSSDCNDNRNV